MYIHICVYIHMFVRICRRVCMSLHPYVITSACRLISLTVFCNVLQVRASAAEIRYVRVCKYKLCMYANTCMYMCLYVYTRTYIYIYIYTYMPCVYLYANTDTHICCSDVEISTHTHAGLCTHTHKHTHTCHRHLQ
jgi:hypothetical protein